MLSSSAAILLASLILPFAQAACTPNTTTTQGLQVVLQAGGQGAILSLCQNQVYSITDTLNFTDSNQEISTEGYPTDSRRATLLIGASTLTTAIAGGGANLNNIKIRNIQINGNRGSSDIFKFGGGNIEIGGDNTGQLVEYVRSYDPRQWSCLHVAEGSFKCANVTIQNNDIGPCGSDAFQEWADGISLSCADSLVQNNVITDPTDGGIVIFESPGSIIRNNTIQAKTRTSLGGINMVDIVPWRPFGNYSDVIVENNKIYGGFATGIGNATYGTNNASAMIKLGIAIGPRVWWSDGRYGTNQSFSATVRNNVLSGAFAFGIAVSSAKDFVIENNTFTGNVSFIGNYGPNCTSGQYTPNPPVPLIRDPSSLSNVSISMSPFSSSPGSNLKSTDFIFSNGTALGLTCFIPPNSSVAAWPYGGGGINAAAVGGSSGSGSGNAPSSSVAASQTSGTAAATSNSGSDQRTSLAPFGYTLCAGLMGFMGGGSLLY